MILRQELEPDIKIAEELYPEILKLIQEFDESTGDILNETDTKKMKSSIESINLLTGMELAPDDLFEYWASTSIEDFAFAISLPSPKKVDNISHQEIEEIKFRISLIENGEYLKLENESPFLANKGVFIYTALLTYYNELLYRNVPTPPEETIYL